MRFLLNYDIQHNNYYVILLSGGGDEDSATLLLVMMSIRVMAVHASGIRYCPSC